MNAGSENERRVLALAPTGKDALATRDVLSSAGIATAICADMADLCRQLDFGVGAVLLTDESLTREGSLAALDAALARQPKWSDVPLVLLASGGANSPVAMQALDVLQNVLVLERPVHLPTFVSAVRTALRSRRRQYEIRDYLDERKRAERALARLAAIVESSDDAIVSKNLDGIIQTWNVGAERLFGYRADEVIGQPITLLLPPERIEEEEYILASIRSGQRVEHLETVRVTKDGRRIDVSVTISPIKDKGGQVIGASKIAHDITERKRVQQELKAAKEAAEAANVAKSRFLANMSHELRTPMNAILGMIDVALSKASDPIVKDCLQTAQGSADLLLMLLNDLLDSARIESGKFELELADFSLRRMLDQITGVLSVQASEKGLSLCCRLPDEMPDAVVGDRMRLRQVLLNLAGNAVKFTQRGEVVISVERTPASDDEPGICSLRFAVRDTGIGIPPSVRERLFQPFAQADTTVARRFGGTGLGLSISKNLVEMMGGRIWVESKQGEGSAFYFTVRLPLAKEVPPDAQTPVAVPTAPPARLRILLAEDNPANQKLAAYVLRDRGHLVEIAENGRQAIDLSAQNSYDVILMDVEMPGLNGLEATAAIRKREAGRRHAPIIAMTAHAMKDDRDRCLAAGMDGYLAKPIDWREMIALVEGFAAAAAKQQRDPSPPQSPGRPPALVFDRKLAMERCADSEEMLAGMVQCFAEDVRVLLPRLQAAIEKGDLEEASRLGHRLKGTLVYLGAKPAIDAATAVEGLQSGSSPAEAEEAGEELRRACELLQSVLATAPGLKAGMPG